MNIHSCQGALALAMICMGLVFVQLGVAEYREHKKWKERRKENSPTNFDLTD